MPVGLDWLWGIFCEISEGRGSSGFGPAAIAWRDIADWQQLMHVTLTPWEIGLVRRLDREFLRSFSANAKKANHVDQGR